MVGGDRIGNNGYAAMKRVNIEPGQFRGFPLQLPRLLREDASGRVHENVSVKIQPYTSSLTPGRVEYAGRLGDTVYCEPTFPDEWLWFVEES